MITALLKAIGQLDFSLFLIINQKLHAAFLDPLMHFLSKPGKGFLVLACIWVALMLFFGKKGKKTALLAILCVALTDSITVRVFKPSVARLRPNHPDFLIEDGTYRDGYNTSYSYPSAHACNAFGVAGVVAFSYPIFGSLWFILAGLIGYSRIYLGQHFPADVLGGCLLGLMIANILCNGWDTLLRTIKRV